MKPDALKYKNYLTIDAQIEFDMLVSCGFDPDLAIAIIEAEWPEHEIYDLTQEDK